MLSLITLRSSSFTLALVSTLGIALGCQPKDDKKPADTIGLSLTQGDADHACPDLIFDFATLGVPSHDLLYTYIGMTNTTVGTSDNFNKFEGTTLKVQPRNCRTFPKGELVIATVQLAKVDAETGRITAQVVFRPDPEAGFYRANGELTRVPVYPVRFEYPDNIYDNAISDGDKPAVAYVLSFGCQLDAVDGFSPCRPGDQSFAGLSRFYQGLEAIEASARDSTYFANREILARKITNEVQALKTEIAAMPTYQGLVTPYEAKLKTLSDLSAKTFLKSRFVSWEQARPVIDYLYSELAGNQSRLTRLKSGSRTMAFTSVVLSTEASAAAESATTIALIADAEHATEFVHSLDQE